METCWFPKNFDPKCVDNFLKKKKNCYYYYYYFVENFEPVNYLKKKKKKPCRAFLFEKSIGFSCKDLGKFSKNLFVF